MHEAVGSHCRWLGWLVVAAIALSGGMAQAQPQRTIVTEEGLGTDKLTTAWLTARHAEQDATLKVVGFGQSLSAMIEFDVPVSRSFGLETGMWRNGWPSFDVLAPPGSRQEFSRHVACQIQGEV